jgi:hypothetical protein
MVGTNAMVFRAKRHKNWFLVPSLQMGLLWARSDGWLLYKKLTEEF